MFSSIRRFFKSQWLLKSFGRKKVCKSSWGAVAYQSSWKHPWWPANCIKLSSTLQIAKGKRQKPQYFQFPSAMSQQKLKVKMLWATGETCKTQKKHWHGSDWPSEASLGDFAHPFLVPPLPVDASFVGGMWGCVMGVMSITFMLKKSFKINLFRNIISVLRCTTSLSVFVGWDRTASRNCTLS